MLISNKYGIYELPNESSNDLRLRILGNQEKLKRSQIFTKLQPSAQSSSQNKHFVNTSKKTVQKLQLNFSCNALKFFLYILGRIAVCDIFSVVCDFLPLLFLNFVTFFRQFVLLYDLNLHFCDFFTSLCLFYTSLSLFFTSLSLFVA